jgi:hypothetical protein
MKKDLKPTVLVSVLAILGIFLIVSPLLFVSNSDTSNSDMVSQFENVVVSEPTEIMEETVTIEETEPSAIIQLDAPQPMDPLVILSQGLILYQNTLKEKEGAQGSLVTANGLNVSMSLMSNGNYKAETGVASSPEWLLIDGRMYARLGEKEIEKQKSGFEKIGKPDAVWTDAAVGTEKQLELLAAGNLANVVADLSPLLENIAVKEGENGSKIIEAKIPLDKAGRIANTYNLVRTPAEMLDPELAYAKVTFTIDSSGMLTGYIVEPPKGKQPVSFLLFPDFEKVVLAAPEDSKVITLEDLARAADLSVTENTPSSPLEEVSPAPAETVSGQD